MSVIRITHLKVGNPRVSKCTFVYKMVFRSIQTFRTPGIREKSCMLLRRADFFVTSLRYFRYPLVYEIYEHKAADFSF